MSQQTGGDFVTGDKIEGDKIGGDKITLGDITSSVVNIHQRALTAAEQARIAQDLERQQLAEGVERLAASLKASLEPSGSGGSLFKDLLPYELNDAELFFGRQRAIQDLLVVLDRSRLTVLHAESGAGKTSLLQAGIAPRLIANGHLAFGLRSRHEDPALTVRRTFLPDSSQAPGLASASLLALLRSVSELLGYKPCLYLFLDQFEEFFSLKKDERQVFGQELSQCLNDPTLNVRWVLALRSEAFGDLAELEEAGIAPFKNTYRLNRMGREDARQAIQEPAQRGGVNFEPSLVETLLAELGDGGEISPVHLSLVCSALTSGVSAGKTVTLQTLQEQNGVEGILRGYLQGQIGSLKPAQRDPARLVLRMLVSADGRRTTKSSEWLTAELVRRGSQPELAGELFTCLVERRLLKPHETEAGLSYELAHDYLLGEIKLDPAEQARKAAQELLDQEVRTHQRHGGLIDAERLTLIEQYRAGLQISEEAAVLLAQSRADVDQEAAEREAQRQRELDQARRLAETRRQRSLVLAAGLVVAVILAVIALGYFQQANTNLKVAQDNAATAQTEASRRATQEAIAVEQGQIALARQLAAQSQLLPLATGPQTIQSGLLAVEALSRSPGIEADQAARRVLKLLGRPVSSINVDGLVEVVAFSPDGRLAAAGSTDNIVRVWEAASGREVAHLEDGNVVSALAFSPDGRMLATGSRNETARVWEIASGAERARMDHSGEVRAVAFSPNGRWVVSGSDDGTARVWEAESGQEAARMTHDGPVAAVIFSPDGGRVVSGSKDGTARVWDAMSGEEVARMSYNTTVSSVDFSPNGSLVASGIWDSTISVWQAANGQEVTRMFQDASVLKVAFSPDGRWVVSGGADKTARVWDVVSGEEVARMLHDGRVPVVAFDPQGKRVVSGSEDGTARVWEAASGEEAARMTFGEQVSSAAFSPDGQWVISGSWDGTARVWEAAGWQDVTHMLHANTEVVFMDPGETGDSLNSVAMSPDGKWLVSGGNENTIRLWEAASGREVWLRAHEDFIYDVTISQDGSRVASGSNDRTARVWEATSGREVRRLLHDEPVYLVRFSPDGSRVVTAEAGPTLHVWEVESGREVAQMKHDDDVRAVAFSPDGRRVVSGGDDDTVRLWDASSGQEFSRMAHDREVLAVAFSPDGRRVVSGSTDGTARVWEADTGREVARFKHDDNVIGVIFSPDGGRVATASADDTARVWDVASGRELAHMVHGGRVYAAAFSPDGKWVVSGSADHTARVWEAATGQEAARLTHADVVYWVFFTPDGRWIVSGSWDGYIRRWPWQHQDVLAELCGRLVRNFTPEEWANYLGDEPYMVSCPNLPEP